MDWVIIRLMTYVAPTLKQGLYKLAEAQVSVVHWDESKQSAVLGSQV